MKSILQIQHKIFTLDNLLKQLSVWRVLNKKIVFTNGVFDILHIGHITSLNEAASYGDVLIVAVNADSSVKKLKGPTRPINNEKARAVILASLLQTDAVIIFEDDTPLELIKQIMPNVLVKGGDYTIEQIAGAKEVLAAGGEVKIAAIIEGVSTTKIIEEFKNN
jgi:D-glycero-beta-D-manno-heptose 1-phosphate adenylyltransferase